MKKFVCVEDLLEFIKGDDGYFWAYDIDPETLDNFIQDGIDKRKVRILYRKEECDELVNNVENALRASRAMSDADGMELASIFAAMYLTIRSSLKESFDKDLEKAKKDILKEMDQELTLNSEVAIANIKKKLKGE